MKMSDFLTANNYTDPDGVCAGYGYQKYDLKSIQRSSEYGTTVKYDFELDTNHPMYDGKQTLVICDNEVYEVC